LNPQLERAVLCGIINGEVSIDKIHEDELSKEGKYVWKACREFDSTKQITPKAVFFHATEVYGADHEEFRSYLKEVVAAGVPQIGTVLDSLARKTIVNDLVNEASAQIATGSYSLLSIKGLIEQHITDKNTLTPLFNDMHDVTPPKGLHLPGLDSINEQVGGLFGLWIVSGMPAAGKSTLALMISLLVAALHRPVLYYDFEQGKSVIRWHAHKALQGNEKKIKQATSRLYIRHNIGMLERDLEMVKEPCLVVVDSIQKVAKGLTYRRESLESWVHKLEGLKQYGHHVILVSEKNRASYGEPTMEGYKETGELEYAADAAFDLMLPDEKDSSVVDVHIVKNRHHKFHGHLTTIERIHDFWFKDRFQPSKEID
jgi:hypothetical protein